MQHYCKLTVVTFALLLFSGLGFSQETQIYSDPNASFKQGLLHFEQGNYITARSFFEETKRETVMATDQESLVLKTNAEYYTARCAAELGQPDAEKLMLGYIEDNHETPQRREVYFQLGQYYFNDRKYADAIDWFEKVEYYELANKDIAKYKFQLGYCYFVKKNFDKSYKLFKDVKGVKNEYYEQANYYYGYIAFQKGDYDETLSSFEKLKDSRRFNKIIPYYVIQIHYQRGEYDQLLAYAEPLLADTRIKYYTEINHLVGQTYFELGDYEEALPYLEYYEKKASKVRKEDVYQLAFVYYETENYAKAIKFFEQLNSVDDTLGQHALYLLGRCYLETGDKSGARNAFMESARKKQDPFVTENALMNYAKLSFEMGFDKEAIAAFKDFIDSYPDSEQRIEAQEQLTEVLLTSNSYNEALEILESIEPKTARMKSAYQKAAYYQGVERLNEQKYEGAEESFQLAMRYPMSTEIKAICYYWKAEIDFQQKQYAKAVSNYNSFLSIANYVKDPKSEATKVNAWYGIAYSHLNEKSYKNARTYFWKTKKALADNGANKKTNKVYLDATLRGADCNFKMRDYPKAISSYNEIIASNNRGVDYALFQKGMIQGLQGNNDGKVATMGTLKSKHKKSTYRDDALYEIGEAWINLDNSSKAVASFNALIDEYPNSLHVRRSYLKLGLIYYNQDKNQLALKNYRYVVEKYPRTQESKEALISIKDISIAMGRPEEYIETLESIPGAQATASEQDSIIYLAAENQFFNGDYVGANAGFDKYLTRFPGGFFNLQAHFYRGECLFDQKKYEESIPDYDFVLNQQTNRFTEKAAAKSARILYEVKGDFETAYDRYELLAEVATQPTNSYSAILGMMRCGLKMNKFKEVEDHATLVLNSSESTQEEIVEAHYTLAKSFYHQDKLEQAYQAFATTESLSQTKMSAEAVYMRALIEYRNGEYEKSLETCFEAKDHVPSYQEWVISSFILMADNYVEMDQLFQAKATVQSVIDHYEKEDELKQRAREKLTEIELIELQQSKIELDNKMSETLDLDTLDGGGAIEDDNQDHLLKGSLE